MNCAQVEILICDYLDGTLAAGLLGEFEGHLASCPGCAELAADAGAAVAFIERVAAAEPPPELLTRILHETPGRDLARRGSLLRRIRSGWLGPLFSPRYAMGMAMTILSFSMLFKFAGIEPRQLRASDMDPVKVFTALDDRVHRTWDRTMKYYDNLRLVIEIQSRLKEWSDQDLSAAQPAPQNQSLSEPGNSARPSGKDRQK